jgi:excisionase family DNA binding protein
MTTDRKPASPPVSVPRCLTIKQLGERTSLSRRTISRALCSGDLEHYRIGSRVLISETAIVAWMDSCRIGKVPSIRSRTLPAELGERDGEGRKDADL